jgi:hypothetical protein
MRITNSSEIFLIVIKITNSSEIFLIVIKKYKKPLLTFTHGLVTVVGMFGGVY